MNELATGAGQGAQPEGANEGTVEAAISDYLRGNGGSVGDIVLQQWLERMEKADPLFRGKITSTFYAMLGGGRIVRDHCIPVSCASHNRQGR